MAKIRSCQHAPLPGIPVEAYGMNDEIGGVIVFCKYIAFFVHFLAISNAAALVDPYAIMDKHYQETGIVKVGDSGVWHLSGSMCVPGMDTQLIEFWEGRERFRRVVTSRTESLIEVCDGQRICRISRSKKVVFECSKLPEEDLLLIKAERPDEIVNRDSHLFALNYGGVVQIGGFTTHKILRTNSLNSDTVVSYIDTTTFMEVARKELYRGSSATTYFSDFRGFDSVVLPTDIAMIADSSSLVSRVQVEHWEFIPQVLDSLFHLQHEDTLPWDPSWEESR